MSSYPADISKVNENSSGIQEVFNMLGVIFVTSLEMLHASSLIGTSSPLPDNLGLMALFFLDFIVNTAGDLQLNWAHEIVRNADIYGVVLSPIDQVEGIDEEVLDNLRAKCEAKKAKTFKWKNVVSWRCT